ncbi:MAG: formate dehydrogenase accessory sulfurtransferase FdhD [Chloroflexota bacterium]
MPSPLMPIDYQQYRSKEFHPIETNIIVETPVSLTVNGEIWLSFMCTPTELEALAAGFLYNEGILQFRDEIAELRVCPSGDNVDIWLNHTVERPQLWRQTSGCTGGLTSTDLNIINPYDNNHGGLTPQDIFRLIGNIYQQGELYRQAGGVHTSAFADRTHVCVLAQDIGRHNTLDKIAGRCLLDGIEVKLGVITTTGRISSEMLQKAQRIGAYFVISHTSPTSLSIQLAQKVGITLIGYARRNQFNVYTHPHRIDTLTASDLTQSHTLEVLNA